MGSETATTAPGGYIDILDLRHPVLSDLQRRTMEEAPEVTLDEGLVLQMARDATGLSDFGDEGFRERMRFWLECGREIQEFSRLGRAGIFNTCVRYASQRLRVEDLVRRHPEILELEIEQPLVIAGLPRSGTTHLQNFLSADPQLRSLPYWEAIRPVPAPDEIARAGEEDPRRTKCVAEWAVSDALLPYFKAMHEYTPDHISEDVELQCIDFGSYLMDWTTASPKWRDYYFAQDHAGTYSYLKKCLQVLNFLTGEKRWLMKCPQHMEQLVPLTAVFPDATVIITHRDPVASIQSAITLVCYLQRTSRVRVEPEKVRDYWIDRYERLLRACVRDHDKLDPARTVDVFFDKFMAAPMTTVERIYAAAGLQLDDALRARMNSFLEANPRGKYGQVRFDLRRDFDVTPQEVRKNFQFYFDRFPVRVELK